MSLRLRINLVLSLVIVAFTIAMAGIIVNDTRSSVREEIESATRVAVQLIETVVRGVYLEAGPADRNQALLAFLRSVGRVRANEIRFYDSGGALLYQSPPSVYRAGRAAPEWFTRLVGPELRASRLDLPGGAIVVTPDPSRSILEAWEELTGFALAGARIPGRHQPRGVLARSTARSSRCRRSWRGSRRWRAAGSTRGCRPSGRRSSARSATASTAWRERSRRASRRTGSSRWWRSSRATRSSSATWRDASRSATRPRSGCSVSAGTSSSAARRSGSRRPAGIGELADTLESIKRREHVELLETERLTKTGRLVDVALSAAPLVDPTSDRVIGEICSMRDITEHRRMQAAEQALEQNRSSPRPCSPGSRRSGAPSRASCTTSWGRASPRSRSIGTAIATRAGDSAPDIRDNARTIVSVAARVYDVAHGIIRRLRPSGLDHLGLAETLRDAVATLVAATPGSELGARPLGRAREPGRSAQHHRLSHRAGDLDERGPARRGDPRADLGVARAGRAAAGDAVVVRVQDDGRGLGTRRRARQRAVRAGRHARARAGASAGPSRSPVRPGKASRCARCFRSRGAERAAQLQT